MHRNSKHYEQAFAARLRESQTPYISVDEARRTLLPKGARLRELDLADDPLAGSIRGSRTTLKSFDFVVYGSARNLLVEVKGRQGPRGASPHRQKSSRLENWVTRDDLASLRAWERLFGDGFDAVLVFVYACEDSLALAQFEETIEHDDMRYGIRAAPVNDYVAHMKTRSPRWGTVDVPASHFSQIAGPLGALAGCAPTLV